MSKFTITRFTIIGAGAAGLCAGIKLLESGQDDFLIFERESRVGGTWQRNTYPGLECDIASPLYCYSFAPNPDWSGPFPPQREIREYLERVAIESGLDPHLRLSTGVRSARWSEARARWRLELESGEAVESQFVISAVGLFGALTVPDIPGRDEFEGTLFHSASWNHDHDLTGARVAVIGSAASAVQFIPEIAPDVTQLHVFQRTANWVLPKENTPYTAEQIGAFHENPQLLAQSRQEVFDQIETSLTNYVEQSLDTSGPTRFEELQQVARDAIEVVEDPEIRAKLTPDHPFGAKRPLQSSVYFQSFNRSNVELVTDEIERITPTGVITTDGREREVDTIVMATGFETRKFVSMIDVEGRGGRKIDAAWEYGAEAYLGVTTSGFPNLFMAYGPNTNGGNSIILMLELQIEYALRLVAEADAAGVDWLDVRRDVMDDYNDWLQKDINKVSVWQTGTSDYYRTASGKIVTQYPHGFGIYRKHVDADDIASFETGKASN